MLSSTKLQHKRGKHVRCVVYVPLQHEKAAVVVTSMERSCRDARVIGKRTDTLVYPMRLSHALSVHNNCTHGRQSTIKADERMRRDDVRDDVNCAVVRLRHPRKGEGARRVQNEQLSLIARRN